MLNRPGGHPAGHAAAQERFKLLATSRSGTMENELSEAGVAGYRFAGCRVGGTAFGSLEAVVS